jgi:hypothetical protein
MQLAPAARNRHGLRIISGMLAMGFLRAIGRLARITVAILLVILWEALRLSILIPLRIIQPFLHIAANGIIIFATIRLIVQLVMVYGLGSDLYRGPWRNAFCIGGSYLLSIVAPVLVLIFYEAIVEWLQSIGNGRRQVWHAAAETATADAYFDADCDVSDGADDREAGADAEESEESERRRAEASSPPRSDPYAVLGVHREMSNGEIHSAWRKLARHYHPDLLAAKDVSRHIVDLATKHLAEINAAYDEVAKERGMT